MLSPPPASETDSRVLLIGAQRLSLESLCALLQKRCEFTVVGVVDTASAARPIIRDCAPDLLLVDADQPEGVDHRLVLDLRCHYPHLPLLALTLYTQPHCMRCMKNLAFTVGVICCLSLVSSGW